MSTVTPAARHRDATALPNVTPSTLPSVMPPTLPTVVECGSLLPLGFRQLAAGLWQDSGRSKLRP
ncbi:MAG TPA: hypothetical protein VFM36_08615, partial [Thermoanaerobaculia bacterium]|nr:hypothetical protein [Thermoanaerobaculia bacterium]